MKITTKKGHHASDQWYGLSFSNKIESIYMFTDKSKYDLGNENQKDWNKLFGFTSGILPVFKKLDSGDERLKYCDFKVRIGKKYICMFNPYHWDSARWGCRYNKIDNTYELSSYVYDKGYRLFDSNIFTVPLNRRIPLSIEKYKNTYFFKGVNNMVVWKKAVDVKETKNYGFTLVAWFGGNEVAPNDVEYLIK